MLGRYQIRQPGLAIGNFSRPQQLKQANIARPFGQRIVNTYLVPRKKASQQISHKTRGGLDDEFMFRRRQNCLNTRFNKRKNRLVEITKENKQIYRRINAQKSFYSSRQLNRSFDSNCSTSRKSISKQSIRSRRDTPVSLRGQSVVSSRLNARVMTNKQSTLTIQSESIRVVKQDSLEKFATMFHRGPRKNKENSTQINSYENRKGSLYSKKTSKQQIRTLVTNMQSVQKQTILPPLLGDGMLHRIAQEIFEQKKSQAKMKKRVLY